MHVNEQGLSPAHYPNRESVVRDEIEPLSTNRLCTYDHVIQFSFMASLVHLIMTSPEGAKLITVQLGISVSID